MQVLKNKLHPKVQEFKRKAGYFLTSSGHSLNAEVPQTVMQRAVATGSASSLLDKRIISGYGFAWGKKDTYGTKFIKGCCARSIRENGPNSGSKDQIKSLWQHRSDDPLANMGLLEEDDYGLYMETLPLDPVESAERCLIQARSGTINGLSGGFIPVWEKAEWDDTDDSLVFVEIVLKEISPVTFNSVPGAHIHRSVQDFEYLDYETEEFISRLPKSHRLEARQLLTRYKSLIVDNEPPEERSEAPVTTGAVTAAIDYQYLINNLKNQ